MYTPRSLEEALEIYRKILIVRLTEEATMEAYKKGEMRTPVHLGIGLEGVSVGVCHLLPPGTKSFGQLRNHGQYLALAGPAGLEPYFAELYGKATGTGGGRAGSMNLAAPESGLVSTSGIVCGTVSLAVGAALAADQLGTGNLACAMFGDAAVEEGEFSESLNFACLHRLRVLFVCEENDLAIHTFGHSRRGFKSLSDLARAYRCHVLEGDGTDVLYVISAVKRALDLAREDPRPVFLLFRWFRFLEHSGPGTDWSAGYRTKPSDEEMDELDPVIKYERYLMAGWGLNAGHFVAIRDELRAEIASAMVRAKAAPDPGPDDLTKEVFAP